MAAQAGPVARTSPARGNWFAVAAFAMLAAVTQMLWLTFAPITTEAADHFSVDETTVGYLSIIFPLLYVVMAIPWGLALDRWFRPALMFGAGLTTLGAIIRVVDPDSFAFTLVGQLVCAIAQPAVLNSVAKLAVDYLPRAQRATGIAVGSAGLFVGMLLSFVLGALLNSDIGALLWVEAAVAVMSLVLIGLALARRGRFVDDVEVASVESVTDATAHPLRASWSDPVIRLLVALIAVGNGVFVALTTWLQPFLGAAGIGSGTADLMLIVLVVAGIVGAAIVPTTAARRGTQARWMLRAIVLGALGCIALALIPGVATGFVVTAVLGFLILAVLPIVLDIVERRAGPAAATATALVWLAGNAGGVVISVVVGLLIGSPSLGFAVMALIMFAAGVPIVMALRRLLRAAVPRSEDSDRPNLLEA